MASDRKMRIPNNRLEHISESSRFQKMVTMTLSVKILDKSLIKTDA